MKRWDVLTRVAPLCAVIIGLQLSVVSAQNGPPPQNTQSSPALSAIQSATLEKINLENQKLKAEIANLTKSQWSDFWKILAAGFITITAPLIVASIQLNAQRKAQKERAAVDALLKAAEITMDAPTTGQVRAKAAVLSALLSDLIPEFGRKLKELDYTKVGFGGHRARFLALLEAISASPDHGLLLAQCYNDLFPDDDDISHHKISRLLATLGKPPNAAPN